MRPTQHTVDPAVYRPVFFFAWSLLLPWAFWCAAAYLSHQSDGGHKGLLTALLLAGLLAPVGLAAGLLWRQPSLRADVLSRLRLSGAPKRYLLAAVLLPPLSLVLAQGVSMLFGYSAGQFHISGSPSFTSALISPWLALVLGAMLEELAWHSYGTDALLSRFSLFAASLIFTVYWALWHVPLGLVKGYYHSELVAQGWLYTANFVASMVVFVLLMNWLYLKSGRSIVVALLFHLAANLGNEIFQTHPDSKVIQTGILLLLTAWVLWKEQTLFFRRPKFKQAG
ncbi:MAG: CPBP family intramembrane metalloprotease [Neisseria zoodegmatis]|uniref:CPBP family intramembrane glutamic endopeptidase n=1 Tax=Neisseria zoodegmatis TaxID=326523 RepID=UPI0026F094E5|nr:CPBP family intramembrane glutamic endopeptidase [Neisseria zoodegmatis]MDO5070668.1 CPBP family intramembrane metalloprotease [Neisseria zoodegmatis]